MDTAERLHNYYNFDQDVINTVAESFDRQAGYGSYQDFFQAVGMVAPRTETFGYGYHPSHFVDIKPKEIDNTLVMHLEMGIPLDPGHLYETAVLAHSNPNTRVIVFANPGNIGSEGGKLNARQRRAVSDGGFKVAVEPVIRYLDAKKISSVDHAGLSLGADLAVGAAQHDSHGVGNLIEIEPTSNTNRTAWEQTRRFISAEPALEAYVKANGLKNYEQARKDGSEFVRYFMGLLRPSNAAYRSGLRDGKHHERLDDALRAHGEMVLTTAFGTMSELADLSDVWSSNWELKSTYGDDRVRLMPLPKQTHALGSDLALKSAIILQARKRTS